MLAIAVVLFFLILGVGLVLFLNNPTALHNLVIGTVGDAQRGMKGNGVIVTSTDDIVRLAVIVIMSVVMANLLVWSYGKWRMARRVRAYHKIAQVRAQAYLAEQSQRVDHNLTELHSKGYIIE